MCGRFTLILHPETIQKELDLGDFPADFRPRYNIAPTQPVAVVTEPQERKVQLFRWGLIPSWAKDPEIGNRMINARAETIESKPAFRSAFARRRCLVLADGYYEWYRPQVEGQKPKPIPYFFHLQEGKPFAFAGLWETWRSPEGEKINSCTILTTAPNELMGRYHDRMPVIMPKEHFWEWLDPEAKPEQLRALLSPFPAEAMDAYPVSPLVNNPSNDFPQCVDSLTAEG